MIVCIFSHKNHFDDIDRPAENIILISLKPRVITSSHYLYISLSLSFYLIFVAFSLTNLVVAVSR